MLNGKPRENFIVEAFNLSNVNPVQWVKFVQALDEYTQELVNSSVAAPHYELPISSGIARQALRHLRDLQDIRDLYQQIKVKREHRG